MAPCLVYLPGHRCLRAWLWRLRGLAGEVVAVEPLVGVVAEDQPGLADPIDQEAKLGFGLGQTTFVFVVRFLALTLVVVHPPPAGKIGVDRSVRPDLGLEIVTRPAGDVVAPSEIAVGRLPVKTPDQLKKVVEKILRFEKAPMDPAKRLKISLLGGASGYSPELARRILFRLGIFDANPVDRFNCRWFWRIRSPID